MATGWRPAATGGDRRPPATGDRHWSSRGQMRDQILEASAHLRLGKSMGHTGAGRLIEAVDDGEEVFEAEPHVRRRRVCLTGRTLLLVQTTARRTRTMDRRPLTTFRRTRRIFIVRGQRRVVRVRWAVVPLRCSVVRGAFPPSGGQRRVVRVRWTVVRLRCSVVRGTFPPSADNGMSSPYYGASYPAHFCRLQTTTRRVHFAAGRGGLTKI